MLLSKVFAHLFMCHVGQLNIKVDLVFSIFFNTVQVIMRVKLYGCLSRSYDKDVTGVSMLKYFSRLVSAVSD